jgi:integrase
VDYWDAKVGFTGFGLRAASGVIRDGERHGGGKTFQLVYRHNGRFRRMKIGRFPELPLADAREVAGHALREIQLGNDPGAEKHAKRQLVREAPTVNQLADAYMERHASGKKTAAKIGYYIDRDIRPRFGKRLAFDVERGEVRQMHQDLTKRAPVGANRVLEVIKSMYAWALKNEFHSSIKINPATGVEKNREGKDKRFLNESEIAALWPALDGLPPKWRSFFRLCLLTGQRPGEVLRMNRLDLDLASNWWVMPEGYTKNGEAHSVPLSDLAREALDEALGLHPNSEYVFPGRGGGAADPGNVPWKKPLQEALKCCDIARFTCDDLRATVLTGLSGEPLSFDEVLVAKVANHANPVITDRYVRHGYDAEKRKALQAWANHVAHITGQRPMLGNVVAIEDRRA